MTEPGGTAPLTSQVSSTPFAEATQLVQDSAYNIDPQIIEALRGEDRSYVLKLGELMESLISDGQRRRTVLLTDTYSQRSLVHQCCAYYQLVLEADPLSGIIYVQSTPESRIPMPILSELALADTVGSMPSTLCSPLQPQLLMGVQTVLPPLANSPSGLESHVEWDTELSNNREHHEQKAPSKTPHIFLNPWDIPEPTLPAVSQHPVGSVQAGWPGSQDGQAFFRARLEEFKFLYRLDEFWPPNDAVLLLSAIARDSIDFATLIIRYLGDSFVGDPQLQLTRLFDIFGKAIAASVQELLHLHDLLCLDILSRIPLDVYAIVKRILIPQVLSTDTLRDKSLAMTCHTLGIAQNEAYEGLRYLHPVMSVPSPQDITHENITIYGDSFLPFLIDPRRSGDYALTEGEEACIAKDSEVPNEIPSDPSAIATDTAHTLVDGVLPPSTSERLDDRARFWLGSDDGSSGIRKNENEVEEDVVLMSQTFNADDTPKRPMNAFMIFARRRRPQVSAENQSMRTSEISKLLSREWTAMPMSEKQFYLDQAKILRENFNSKYPDYVYRRRPNVTRKKNNDDTTVLRQLDNPGPQLGDMGGHDLGKFSRADEEALDPTVHYTRVPHDVSQAYEGHSRYGSVSSPYSISLDGFRPSSTRDARVPYPTPSDRMPQEITPPRLGWPNQKSYNYPYQTPAPVAPPHESLNPTESWQQHEMDRGCPWPPTNHNPD